MLGKGEIAPYPKISSLLLNCTRYGTGHMVQLYQHRLGLGYDS